MKTWLLFLGVFLCFGKVYAKPDLSYWIWAGIKPEPHMQDSVLYVYQGHIQAKDKRFKFEHIGMPPHPLGQDIFVVYRITGALPRPQEILSVFNASRMHWERHKVKVKGLQLDFDSPTSKLLLYNDLLKEVRQCLDPSYTLSITGLSDWIVFGDQADLNEVVQTTDEVVFQLYQGRKHFPEIKTYLKKLKTRGIPFKIGLLAKEDPAPYISLVKDSPNFKGTVLFVQKGCQ